MDKNKKKLELAICILFFEKVGQTKECVDSFAKAGVKIYVLNNGSSEKSLTELRDYCRKWPDVIFFEAEKNLGVSGGRNNLIKNTEEEWLFFVDNDITIKTIEWLEIVSELIERNPETEVFIPKLYNLHDKRYEKYLPFIIRDKTLLNDENFMGDEINRFAGGASVISRKVFDRLGLYAESMFVGFEDFEMALRGMVKNQPIRAKIIELIELVHDHRVAVNVNDKASASARYDSKKHLESEKYIREKYGIRLEPSWRYWLKNQKRLLVDGKNIQPLNVFQRIFLKVTRIIRRYE